MIVSLKWLLPGSNNRRDGAGIVALRAIWPSVSVLFGVSGFSRVQSPACPAPLRARDERSTRGINGVAGRAAG